MWLPEGIHVGQFTKLWLSEHKADQYFEDKHLIIQKHSFSNAYFFFMQYLTSLMCIFKPNLNFGYVLISQYPHVCGS